MIFIKYIFGEELCLKLLKVIKIHVTQPGLANLGITCLLNNINIFKIFNIVRIGESGHYVLAKFNDEEKTQLEITAFQVSEFYQFLYLYLYLF